MARGLDLQVVDPFTTPGRNPHPSGKAALRRTQSKTLSNEMNSPIRLPRFRLVKYSALAATAQIP